MENEEIGNWPIRKNHGTVSRILVHEDSVITLLGLRKKSFPSFDRKKIFRFPRYYICLVNTC